MIDYRHGDILADDAQALVNTVNVVGVMGKGIALQFKRRFPGNFDAYKDACESGDLRPGRMFVWPTGQLEPPNYVINFPTKRHWRADSRLSDIEAGLQDLLGVLIDLKVASVAIPPLGCGNGGLDWADVQPLIEQHLGALVDVDVRVYEPAGAPAPAVMAGNTLRPHMTPHRAAMLVAFAQYLQPGYTLGRTEAQKLLYFLQVAGAPYDRLEFVRGPYGPYADAVRHVLNHVEGHFIEGFGDATSASTIRVVDTAVDDARQLLAADEHDDFRRALTVVAELTDGFDDSYGLELLASVHWVATRNEPRPRNSSEATEALHQWSERKRQRYSRRHVTAAWQRLEEFGLVATSVQEPAPTSTPSADDQPDVASGDVMAHAL